MWREAAVRMFFATGELLGGKVRGMSRVSGRLSHWVWSYMQNGRILSANLREEKEQSGL